MTRAPAKSAATSSGKAAKAAPAGARPAEGDPVTVRPEGIARNALVILAVIASAAALYWMRGILTPLALAMFLAIMIDSFARRLEHRWPRLPDSVSFLAAIVLSLLIFGGTLVVVADRASGFIVELAGYGPRLDELIARLAAMVGVQAPPPLTQMVDDLNPAKYVGEVAQGLQGVVSDAVFVLIYLGFIIASRRGFKRKIVALFPHNQERSDALEIFNRIRFGVERYLWVQTVTGLMIAAGSWLAMIAVGLENALFWAFLIFLAAYIPIIGGFIGIVFPAVFGLVQFDTLWQGFVLLGVLYGIQFVVGNIITPRMQGDSLNIDPVVVLLALALWGALWGLPGMFLSTPLAVMAMIILAEFDGSRWIAILMSENGDPQGVDEEGRHRRRGKRFGQADDAP
ncbi:MAG TPA: AI-2E family transporter [Caulobacter sp.]|nr:AI-2E family transporter [Caulobacter sp.]